MGERDALEVFYSGWASYQEALSAAAATLTDEQLQLRAAPHLRSVGELLTHLVAVRAGWFRGDLGMGGDEFLGIARWDEPGAAAPTADELRAGLASTWRLVHQSLDSWTPDDLTETVHSAWPGQEDETYVRGWVVYHVLEHDLHHGGELGYMLGMHGLPTPRI
ncbi:MAG: DinB family protein [Chloroflexi bacterium]|nr:DinB family protein [Chloroflexota bacterium]